MKHVRPLSKAAMDWGLIGPLDRIRQVLAFLTFLLPALEPKLEDKNGEEPEETET